MGAGHAFGEGSSAPKTPARKPGTPYGARIITKSQNKQKWVIKTHAPVREQLEEQGGGDLVRDVGHADVEEGQLHLC